MSDEHQNQLDPFSRSDDAGGESEGQWIVTQSHEDALPSTHSPVHPTTLAAGPTLEHAALRVHTDSTSTIVPDGPPAGTTPLPNGLAQPRLHAVFYATREYGAGYGQRLTEQAKCALDEASANGPFDGNVDQWIHDGSRFPHASRMDVRVAELRGSRSQTVARTGSITQTSSTVASSPAPLMPQRDHEIDICAAGQQFDEVTACPNNSLLTEEDCT